MIHIKKKMYELGFQLSISIFFLNFVSVWVLLRSCLVWLL